MPEDKYFDATKVVVKRIDKSIAEEMIIKHHYSHKWSLCQVAYGIFYITDKPSRFFDTVEENLIGCIVFGQPVGRSAAESISSIIKINEVFELVRLWIADGYGKNIESYCIMQSIGLVKKNFPHIKVIISYADSEAGHKGIIYQACNFYYQGFGNIPLMPNYSISLIGPPYKWIHSRTVSSTYGSHNVEWLKKKVGHTFYRKKESNKHRYFYLLSNKKEKRIIIENLKHPILPYPKNTDYKDEVEKIVVKSEGCFFD